MRVLLRHLQLCPHGQPGISQDAALSSQDRDTRWAPIAGGQHLWLEIRNCGVTRWPDDHKPPVRRLWLRRRLLLLMLLLLLLLLLLVLVVRLLVLLLLLLLVVVVIVMMWWWCSVVMWWCDGVWV